MENEPKYATVVTQHPRYTAVPADEAAPFCEGTVEAPENMVWVCGACGKTSRTKYGWNEQDARVCDPGRDSSCMMNSVLCYKIGEEPAEEACVDQVEQNA